MCFETVERCDERNCQGGSTGGSWHQWIEDKPIFQMGGARQVRSKPRSRKPLGGSVGHQSNYFLLNIAIANPVYFPIIPLITEAFPPTSGIGEGVNSKPSF